MVLISDARVAGPAAAPVSERPNRVGSAEVPVRIYEPEPAELRGDSAPWGTLVWAHGGSFVRGTLDWPEADWAARRFAEAGLKVYSVDYVLASDEAKAPSPANDVKAVLRHVHESHPGPVFVGGASAGAHLAVLAALGQAELAEASGDATVRPDALALVYPTLHRLQRADEAIAALTESLPIERRFGPERIAEMYKFYLGEDPAAPSAADVAGELPAERLGLLPPTVIVNAEADDLRASAEQFAEQLRASGVNVTEIVQPGTVHGYLNRPDESPRATRDAQTTIDLLVRGLLTAVSEGPKHMSVFALQRLVDPGATRELAGLPLLPTPPLEHTGAYPVGYTRLFWRSFLGALLAVGGIVTAGLFAVLNGARVPETSGGAGFLFAALLIALAFLFVAGFMRLFALIRARGVLLKNPGAFVIEQLHQSDTSYAELLALGGKAPRNGQFGMLTLGVSRKGLTVRADLGDEVLHLDSSRVLEVRIEPRQLVKGSYRSPIEPRDALVFIVRCDEGVRTLSALPADARTLGVRALRGERLRKLRGKVERELGLGEVARAG